MSTADALTLLARVVCSAVVLTGVAIYVAVVLRNAGRLLDRLLDDAGDVW